MMLAQRGLFLVVMGSPPGGVVRAATNARATTGVLCSDGFFSGWWRGPSQTNPEHLATRFPAAGAFVQTQQHIVQMQVESDGVIAYA